MVDREFPVNIQRKHKNGSSQAPVGCAACAHRRPGWFCSLGSAVLADLELATSTISLSAQAPLFTEGEEARCLYLICGGYLKLTAGRPQDRQMIVRVAGPGSVLGLYAVLAHGVYEVSAESLTPAQLRPVERDRFLNFLRSHKEAQMHAVQCICQEYALPCKMHAAFRWPKPLPDGWGVCSSSWATRLERISTEVGSAFRCC
jgi:CRP/FNR family transcriptional regulator